MHANTAEVPKQPIIFPNFSVENKPYKTDPFTIRDGRYVGHDGFIVPKNFDEFYERLPQYVRNWVNRHADRTASKEDVEDWTQDLLFHLQHLSANSKYREAGKEDIVQTFDPQKHYGANQARFQNYINLCLTNKFRTLHSKRLKDALSQPGNVSLDTQREAGDPFSVSDEFCHWHSDHLQRAANASEKRDQDRAFVGELVDFIRREDPNVLPAVEALSLARTLGEASDFLCVPEAQFNRMRNRLLQLARCFLNGEPVPRQRKPYKSRVKRSRTTPLSERSVSPVTRPLLDPTIDPCKGGDDFDQTFARAALSEFTLLGSLTGDGEFPRNAS
jgi:hypothetical protein